MSLAFRRQPFVRASRLAPDAFYSFDALISKGVWKPAIRYDCAHDFAHRDRYNLKGDRDKEEIALSYTDSLDLADKDINDNWDIYRRRFLRGDFP